MKRFLAILIVLAGLRAVHSPGEDDPPNPPGPVLTEFPAYAGFEVARYELLEHTDLGMFVCATSTEPKFVLSDRWFHILRAESVDGQEVLWQGSQNPVWGQPYLSLTPIGVSIDRVDRRPEGNPQELTAPPFIVISWDMENPVAPQDESLFWYSVESSTDVANWPEPPGFSSMYGSGKVSDEPSTTRASVCYPIDVNKPAVFFRVRVRCGSWRNYVEPFYIDGYMPTRFPAPESRVNTSEP